MRAHPPAVIPVGDPRRPLIGRAAFGTLLVSAAFFLFTATKQMKPVYVHAPWLNDPYDTVFSFTMFFVPLVAGILVVQVSLCRKSEPLPVARVVNVLRGCRVAVGAIMVELLTAWVSVAVGANRSDWTGDATGLLLALLVLCTTATSRVIADLHRAPRFPSPDATPTTASPDWLADAVTVARRESRWLGPLRRPVLMVLDGADRTVVRTVRRHPLGAAVASSATFAVTVFGWQSLREGYSPALTVLSLGLGFCGMFAFLVLAGSYLGVVRSQNPLHGVPRRLLDASVVGSIVAIAALAFRDSLWWIVGSDTTAAGAARLATMVGGGCLAAFALVLVAETLLRSHPRSAH
ncbi:MAG TPA: hypothetical protein VN791_06570 [Acidimicrobiales bacterium]|nr:hypothetical protein [Acidimicrobiales bacterium]